MSGRENRAQEERICKICTGRATGYHFGVMSCEGCKGFFRRNVQKGARFICNYEKNCDVTGERRKNCQACRMAKCESTGMRRDRIMIGQHRKNRRTEERRRKEAEKAAAEAAAAAAAAASNEPKSPEEEKMIIKTESPQATNEAEPRSNDSAPFIPNLGPTGPIVPTATQFSYPDIKREKTSPPLPQSPVTPQQAMPAVPPQAVASPIAPCHPGLAISNSSPLPNVAPQFPQTLVHQNPLGVPPNPHPQAAAGFNNFLDAAQNSWNPQFQYGRVGMPQLPHHPPQNSIQPPQQSISLPLVSNQQQGPFIPSNIFDSTLPNLNPQRNNNNYNMDQIFGQTLQSAITEAPSLLDSPAISNSPQSNPVIASELQKPPQIQTEELPNGNSNGDSTGCPTPNNVAGSSINSTESSTLGVVLAARKAFDMENNYLMNARHHGYIAQQIQEKKQRDLCGRKSPNTDSQLSSASYERLAHWVESTTEYTAVSHEDLDSKNHEPLTTPNGSLQSNERIFVQHNNSTGLFDEFSMHSVSDSSVLSKRTKFVEFLADLMESGIKQIINYCKLIPEFVSLSLGDQIQLLRNTILELLILKCFFDYKDGSFVNGAKGLWLYREDFLFATSDTSFIDNMMELMAKMAEINMTEEDTLLLMLVALFSDDRQNSCIADRNKIAASRDHFLGIMERAGLTDSRDRRHTSKVLLLLPLLRTLNTSFMEVLKKVQQNTAVDMRTISKLIQFDLKIYTSGNGPSSRASETSSDRPEMSTEPDDPTSFVNYFELSCPVGFSAR